MKVALVLAVTVLALAAPAFGILYTRCSLAQKLSSMGVARNELAIWTCIAEHESSYRSWVVGPTNGDGSRDYGLFQLNDKYWCQPDGKFSYNECNVSCNTLLGDDLWPSLNCARKIKNQQGWGAWATWHYCNGNLPSINSCF